MIKTLRLFILLAVAFSLPSLLSAKGNRTPKTENCTIVGDIDSAEETVVIGDTNPQTVVYENGTAACLDLSNSILLDYLPHENGPLAPLPTHCEDGEECRCPDGWYQGQLSFWVGSQSSGTLNFLFGPEPCATPNLSTSPNQDCVDCGSFPFWDDEDDFCPYHLVIRHGSYDKGSNMLMFDESSWVELYDGTMGGPWCAVVENPVACDPDNCDDQEPCGDCNCFVYLVDEDVHLSGAGITVQFIEDTSGGGDQPTESGGQCKDGKDNDGDGAIDCDDPDCAGTKWCKES